MADVHRRPLGRIALLLPGGVALLLGLDAGLLLLGLPAPLRWSRLPDVHGVLMVLGFVGTVVALERAVALRRTWGYLAPAGFGVGALLLVSAAPAPAGGGVLVLGAAALSRCICRCGVVNPPAPSLSRPAAACWRSARPCCPWAAYRCRSCCHGWPGS
jgi:hypothetical protein